jgi:hypothetical protein
MRILLTISAALLALAGAADAEVRFRPVDVYVDSGDAPLAAYQVEITYDKSRIKIAGLEGGETKAFKAAPYYDPRGLQAGRIMVAAFLPEKLEDSAAPTGRTRVARLHLYVEADDEAQAHKAVAEMKIRLIAAASPEAEKITPFVELARPRKPAKGEAQ